MRYRAALPTHAATTIRGSIPTSGATQTRAVKNHYTSSYVIGAVILS